MLSLEWANLRRRRSLTLILSLCQRERQSTLRPTLDRYRFGNRRSLCLETVDKARALPVCLSRNGSSGF